MKPSASPTETAPERTFVRLTLNERIQHIVLVVTFTTLVVTGLPVRYHEAVWARWIFFLTGGPVGRALVHRTAALGLMGLGVYHLAYMMFTDRGHKEVMALIPRLSDARDAIEHMLYYLGRRKKGPRFGRFSYVEKFEYLAVVWGTFIMGTTGLLLWFEVQAMLVLPKWVLDICRIVHGYEALLAFLAIIIWHLYCVHFNADVFPMSRVWLDGKISEKDMKHHHPLEYEEILREEEAARQAARPRPNGGRRLRLPAPDAEPSGNGADVPTIITAACEEERR